MHEVCVKIILPYIDLKVYSANIATEFVNHFIGKICGNMGAVYVLKYEKGC